LFAPLVEPLFEALLVASFEAFFEVVALPAEVALGGLVDCAEEPEGTHEVEAPWAPPIVMPMTPTATPAAARRLKPDFVYMREPFM
jgi:hypothetical protein